MLYKVLDKGSYRDFIKALISKYEFIGPKKKTGQFMILLQ
ncbi:unnamed protein product, partial [marine sediment metagenome]